MLHFDASFGKVHEVLLNHIIFRLQTQGLLVSLSKLIVATTPFIVLDRSTGVSITMSIELPNRLYELDYTVVIIQIFYLVYTKQNYRDRNLNCDLDQ